MTERDMGKLVLERRDYLIDAIRTMNNALDNELVGDVLLELRKTLSVIEGWEPQKHEYISNQAYDCHGREAMP